MIHLPASVRVYLCLTACDMRNYVLFIVMGCCAAQRGDLAGFRDAARRITRATLSEALLAACRAVGNGHDAKSVESPPPSHRVFR